MARLVEAMHPKELDYSDYSRHRYSKKRNNILLCGIEASRSIEVPSIALGACKASTILLLSFHGEHHFFPTPRAPTYS